MHHPIERKTGREERGREQRERERQG